MPFPVKVIEVGNLTSDRNAYVMNNGYGTMNYIKKIRLQQRLIKGLKRKTKMKCLAECLRDGNHGIEMASYTLPPISSTPITIGLF